MQWRVIRGTRELVLPAGALPLSEPRRRTWQGVRLIEDVPVPATRTATGWDLEAPAEVDVLIGDLPSAAVESLLVLGAFTELGGIETLGRFLVGGQVLDTTDFGGARCPSEQTALGIYRIAKHRGWEGVAQLMVGWTRRRIADGLVHDLLGHGETHTRFVADAVLLLAAEGHDVTAVLEPLRVGSWWKHDSLEDGSDRVLNTHLLALITRRAVGIVDDVGVRELHAALKPHRAYVHAVDVLAGDLGRGWFPRHPLITGHAHASQQRAARLRQRTPHLVLPGGWTARDVRPELAAAYHTVNTSDLASYAVITADPLVRRASEAAARYARLSGHWRGLRRDNDAVLTLVPGILVRLGQHERAEQWARDLRADGWAPALGWPGYADQPWARLPASSL